ncbi:MAG: peptidase M23 [Neisseriaceae bacterium]|nr:peptidase M23 [Neisseriaceae bacterium]
MDNSLSLQTQLYPRITPAGAYYAISGYQPNPSRNLLYNILRLEKPKPVSKDIVLEWAGTDNYETAVSLLYRLQRLEFLYGEETPTIVSQDNLESRLPEMLGRLSDTGKALIADDNGLYFATAGFHHESSEEIAALAGEVARLSEQHALLIKNNLNINQNSWSVCDPTGRSELAFFPMYFGDNKLILVIGGNPQLQNDSFVELIQVLYRRYGVRQ